MQIENWTSPVAVAYNPNKDAPDNVSKGERCSMACAPCPLLAAGDEQLLLQWAKGDRDALEELFRRYRTVAYRVAHRLLGNEADALDAVQEGFIKALTHLPAFEGRSSFKTWLLRVVTNASLDLGRQRGRREALAAARLEQQRDGEEPASRDDPADGLTRADLRRVLQNALDQLPEAQRRTFVLHAEAELSYREVADVLGISIGTVMSRLYYARQRLRAYLKTWVKGL
jgi:RNA polymerase sigma-70 factor, ECF subfamily